MPEGRPPPRSERRKAFLRVPPRCFTDTCVCTGGADVIRMEAWSFCRTISGVRLYWELEEPKGPKGHATTQAARCVKQHRTLVSCSS